MIALWRVRRRFKALAMTLLVLVLWLIGWEIVAAIGGNATWLGLSARSWAIAMSPWQAVQEAAQPIFDSSQTTSLLNRSDPVLCCFLIASMVAIRGCSILWQ